MSLNSICVHGHDFVESIEGNVSCDAIGKVSNGYMNDLPNVVVAIAKKLPQYIDCHYSKTTVSFNLQDSQDCLI